MVAAMIRGRLHRRPQHGEAANAEDEVLEIDPGALSGTFSTPRWLRDMGVTAWLLVGVTLLLVGAVWIMSLTHTIVVPVITAAVVASVASPLVGWLGRHRMPRGLSAALIMVSIIALGAGVVLVIVAGITSQSGDLSAQLSDAKDTVEGWLKDLGVDPARRRMRRMTRARRSERASARCFTGWPAASRSSPRWSSFSALRPSASSFCSGRPSDPLLG
jgi:hypothetical protein